MYVKTLEKVVCKVEVLIVCWIVHEHLSNMVPGAVQILLWNMDPSIEYGPLY